MKAPVFASFCAAGPDRPCASALSLRFGKEHVASPVQPVSGQIVLSETENGERARAAGLLNSASALVGLQPLGKSGQRRPTPVSSPAVNEAGDVKPAQGAVST